MAQYKLGIQLYTVRDACDTDFTGTLQALAKMGYQGFEFAWNYGGMSPEALAAFLKELGVQAAGLHTSLEEIANPDSDTYKYALATGAKYLTTSLAGEVAKDWKATIADVAKAAAVAKAQGLVFTYHNHAQEFEMIDGVYALDLLYQMTDADVVKAELDTFWIQTGGADPVAYIKKYAGRVPEVHVKDMDAETKSFTEVGNGILDWDAIFAAAQEAGAEWMIVEQDICAGSSVESARKSISFLQDMGLV